MPDIGNVLDSIFKPAWLDVAHNLEALANHVETTAKADLQMAQSALAAALNNAASAATDAQSKVDAAVNPIVNEAIDAAGKALSAAYPPFAPLVAAAEAEVQALADKGTDTILIALIQKAAGLLSQAGKSVAAVNLANIAGAH